MKVLKRGITPKDVFLLKILSKLVQIKNRIFAFFSSKRAKELWYRKWHSSVHQSHSEVNILGKFTVSDPNNLVVGKGVTIGRNCKFISDGGIYISDNSIIPDNTILNTCPSQFNPSKVPGIKLKSLLTKFIDSNSELPVRTPDFFILSTGRSGTNAIAKSLSNHSQISCLHEPRMVLNRLSTELAHGFKTRQQVREELDFMYNKITFNYNQKSIIGECDQKLVNIVPILHELFPKAKFIWLIRQADDFVASAYGRRWFDEYEYTYPNPKHSFDTNNDYSIFEPYRIPYSKYRLNGMYAGILKEEEWKSMGCFERCCWYWNYWNELIEINLKIIDDQNKYFIRLEDLDEKYTELLHFLGVNNASIEIENTNKAYYKVEKMDAWTKNQKEIFEKRCGENFRKWYGKE